MAITQHIYGHDDEITVELHVYEDETKYTASGVGKIVQYEGVVRWDIVDGEDATAIEAHTDGSCIDEFHEYLVLHFGDGSDGTFRNSHVDLYRIEGPMN